MRAIAVTTISQQSSLGIQRLFNLAEITNSELVVIGDRKTPAWNPKRLPQFVHYFSIEDQEKKWPKLSGLLPINHYARKNLSYLWALENDVDVLLDTDDDNYSNVDIFSNSQSSFRSYKGSRQWVNVYAHFGRPEIWPRGLPLEEALKPLEATERIESNPTWYCFQSIVDGDPDLDAIGRMLNPQQRNFEDFEPLALGTNNFCPTNSQATLWERRLIPFLYLPITSTFRMTDIWRGIIISGYQNLYELPTMFGKLGFKQERNEHNLTADFVDEVPGHIYNRQIKEISDKIWRESLGQDNNFDTFKEIYKSLSSIGILKEVEIECVSKFIEIASAF